MLHSAQVHQCMFSNRELSKSLPLPSESVEIFASSVSRSNSAAAYSGSFPYIPSGSESESAFSDSEAGSAISLSSESDVSSEISSSVDMIVATVLIGVVLEWKCINGRPFPAVIGE